MSDDDKIIKLLQDEGAPPLGEVAARRITNLVVTEFKNTQPRKAGFFASFRLPVMAAAGFAALVVACFFAWKTLLPDVGAVIVAGGQAERERIILAQFNEMFDGRLQAVVTVNGKTQIVLGEQAAARGQPVAIHLSEQSQKIDIISFSGENLQVSIGGREVNFDTLVDAKGGVILAGENLFWNGGKAEGEPGLKINAKMLEM